MRKHGRHLSLEELESRVVLDGDDTLARAIDVGPFTRTAAVSGAIDSATDVDLFKVYLRRGEDAGFDVDTAENGPPGLGSYLRLFDPEGREVASNNDAVAPGDEAPAEGDGFDSYFGHRIGRDGWYYVGVSNWLNTAYRPETGDGDHAGDRHLTGPYRLTITSERSDHVLFIRNRRAAVAGSRGEFRDGVFAPTGEDTRSQDYRSSHGGLTRAQEARYREKFRQYLRGEDARGDAPGGPTRAELRSIMDPVASRFLGGGGGTWAHKPGGVLASLVRASASFRAAHENLKSFIRRDLAAQLTRGVADFAAIDLARFFADKPSHDVRYPQGDRDTPFPLRAVLGETQGIRASVVFEEVTPGVAREGGGTLEYQATVRYEVFDVFGAGNLDRGRSAPARHAMWQLQHRGRGSRPFNNQVLVDEGITDRLDVPGQYDSYVAE